MTPGWLESSIVSGRPHKQALRGGGSLERGHRAALDRLAQLGDALSGVGAFAGLVDAAERVVGQAVPGRRRVSMGADTQAIT